MREWITDKLLKLVYPLVTPKLGSFLRHGLTALSGYLVGKGIISAESADQVVAVNYDLLMGVGTFAIAQLASLIEKLRKNK